MATRGRPEFRPTDEQRDSVEICVSGGMSQVEIAAVLGITKPTLEKHFADELANGGARKRAEVLGMLYASGRKGNVTAQKYLHAVTGVQAAAAEWEAAEGPAKALPKRPALGKKELAELAARTAGQGSEWGDDLVPNAVTH
jgi:DNA-binding CsgD family transcriptional regulator